MNFKIYQLNHEYCEKERENGNLRVMFASYDETVKDGILIRKKNYDLKWDGECILESESVSKVLNKVFSKFQNGNVEGFRGHSLSVSDVVEIDGVGYYCDDLGWRKLTEMEWNDKDHELAESSRNELLGKIEHLRNNGLPHDEEGWDYFKKYLEDMKELATIIKNNE